MLVDCGAAEVQLTRDMAPLERQHAVDTQKAGGNGRLDPRFLEPEQMLQASVPELKPCIVDEAAEDAHATEGRRFDEGWVGEDPLQKAGPQAAIGTPAVGGGWV